MRPQTAELRPNWWGVDEYDNDDDDGSENADDSDDSIEDVLLVEFLCLVFTHIEGDRYLCCVLLLYLWFVN